MNIAEFKTTKEVNEFVKTVKLDHIELVEVGIFKRIKYIVFYRPYLTVEEVRAQKILEDENETMVNLTQSEMHLIYLEETVKNNPKAQSGIDNTLENRLNDEAKLIAIDKWKQL